MDRAAFAKPFDQSIHQVHSSPFVKFVIGQHMTQTTIIITSKVITEEIIREMMGLMDC
jgi:hypothetical protein